MINTYEHKRNRMTKNSNNNLKPKDKIEVIDVSDEKLLQMGVEAQKEYIEELQSKVKELKQNQKLRREASLEAMISR